ncbi:MAG: LysR family transcriptional regulator [Methylophaga sp.]|nr:MAG: LysR family transcriptional regulator [Methylophaga sp.]
MNLPTLRQLQYLVAVVDLKHFGRAADHCFVTQSTLSAGIHDLESLLDVRLIERTNRKVLPTALGIDIAQRAQYILSLSADLVDVVQSEQSPLTGRIRLGVIPSICPFLLPKALAVIRHKMPLLELILIEDQSEPLVNKLRSGEIDVALLAFPFEIKALNHHIFGEEPFWVALPQNHPLASKQHIVADQLPVDDLLLLSEGHCLREHALSACQLPATAQRTSVQGTSLYTLIEMVAGGLGVTLIPEMAINSDMISHADICIRPLIAKNNRPMRELGLVWRPSYQRSKTLALLSEAFATALKETLIQS